jgi:hypothetical protein
LIIYNNMKKKHKNVVLPVLPIQFILQVKTWNSLERIMNSTSDSSSLFPHEKCSDFVQPRYPRLPFHQFQSMYICIYMNIFVYLPHHGFNMFQHHLFNFHEWFIRFHDLFETWIDIEKNLFKSIYKSITIRIWGMPWHAASPFNSLMKGILQFAPSLLNLSWFIDAQWYYSCLHNPRHALAMFCPTSPSLLICTDHRCNVHLFFLDGRPVISDNCIIQGPRQKNDPFRHLSYTVNLHAVSVCISMCLSMFT